MKDDMNLLRRFLAVAAVMTVLLQGDVRAQILSRGDLFGPGAPPPMAGIEIALGQHTQQGTFQGNCNCTFDNGTGSGFLGRALFELPLDYEWAVGIMIGPDFKKFSGTTGINEQAIIQYTKNASEII